MKTLFVAVALVLAIGRTFASPVTFDPTVARLDAIGRQLEGPTRTCMYSAAAQQLAAGVRDSQQIQGAQMRLCAGPMLALLGNGEGVRAFLRAIGAQELSYVPGVR